MRIPMLTIWLRSMSDFMNCPPAAARTPSAALKRVIRRAGAGAPLESATAAGRGGTSGAAGATSSGAPILPARLVELDGVRGLACVAVLIHHTLLTTQALSEIGAHPGAPTSGPLSWALTRTPLHLLWGGYEAVLVFFVLSGISLVYPVARRYRQGRPTSWAAYYPQRLIRLYAPFAAATALTAVCLLVAPRPEGAALSDWVMIHETDASPRAIAKDLLLMRVYSFRNNPLWTLRYEIIFSLVLPLVIAAVALAARLRLSLPLLAALLLLAREGTLEGSFFLPVFAVGAVIGWHWGRTPTPLQRTGWATPAACLALVAIMLPWYLSPLHATSRWWATPAVIAAVAALLTLIVRFGACGSVLRSAPVQWLGRLSFSLYLVHDPVILTLRHLTADHSPAMTLVAAPPLAFLVAIGFQRVIEQPAHRLSRSVGRRIEGRLVGRGRSGAGRSRTSR